MLGARSFGLPLRAARCTWLRSSLRVSPMPVMRSPLRQIGTRWLSATAAPAAESAATPSLRARWLPFGLWTLVSLQIGTYFSQGDEGAQLLLHFDHVAALLLGVEVAEPTLPHHITSVPLAEQLERLARAATLNDSLKLRLLQAPGVIDRLVQLVQDDAPKASHLPAQRAAKVLEAISSSDDAQRGEFEDIQRSEMALHARLYCCAQSPAPMHCNPLFTSPARSLTCLCIAMQHWWICVSTCLCLR